MLVSYAQSITVKIFPVECRAISACLTKSLAFVGVRSNCLIWRIKPSKVNKSDCWGIALYNCRKFVKMAHRNNILIRDILVHDWGIKGARHRPLSSCWAVRWNRDRAHSVRYGKIFEFWIFIVWKFIVWKFIVLNFISDIACYHLGNGSNSFKFSKSDKTATYCQRKDCVSSNFLNSTKFWIVCKELIVWLDRNVCFYCCNKIKKDFCSFKAHLKSVQIFW